ncbi:hypothetical protein CS8_099010 [Cupriavidus sp. 8B]
MRSGVVHKACATVWAVHACCGSRNTVPEIVSRSVLAFGRAVPTAADRAAPRVAEIGLSSSTLQVETAKKLPSKCRSIDSNAGTSTVRLSLRAR